MFLDHAVKIIINPSILRFFYFSRRQENESCVCRLSVRLDVFKKTQYCLILEDMLFTKFQY